MPTLTPHQRSALRAGATAYTISTLLLLLLVAPMWAADTNFPGHHHPEGTPLHGHSLAQVGLASAPVFVSSLGLPSAVEHWFRVPRAPELPHSANVERPGLARGPPGPTIC